MSSACDPSGLVIELVASDRDRRVPWLGAGIEAAAAVRGVHSVTLQVRVPDPTVEFMTGVLGYRVMRSQAPRSEHGR